MLRLLPESPGQELRPAWRDHWGQVSEGLQKIRLHLTINHPLLSFSRQQGLKQSTEKGLVIQFWGLGRAAVKQGRHGAGEQWTGISAATGIQTQFGEENKDKVSCYLSWVTLGSDWGKGMAMAPGGEGTLPVLRFSPDTRTRVLRTSTCWPHLLAGTSHCPPVPPRACLHAIWTSIPQPPVGH